MVSSRQVNVGFFNPFVFSIDAVYNLNYDMTMHQKHKSKIVRREISRDTLEGLYMSERSVLEICAELEIHPQRLYKLLDVAGIPRRRGAYQPSQRITLSE